MDNNTTHTQIIGTGLSGLVGSKFIDLYKNIYTFQNLDLTNGVNILDESAVMNAVRNSQSQVVLHMAGYTDVNKAFEETGNTEGITYKVNVIGTRNIVRAAKEYGKYLIHISTAFVFNGKKQGLYIEDDQISPIEWYGHTKALAEEEVMKEMQNFSILRIDRPYRLDTFTKLDIVHKIIEKLASNSLPPQFGDTSWTPTSIEKLSDIFNWCIQHTPQGIFHATTEPVFSDYSFAEWVKETFHVTGDIHRGSLEDYLKTNPRPYQKNTALDTSKLFALMRK